MSTITADVMTAVREAMAGGDQVAHPPRKSQATQLVDLALEGGIELWHTSESEAWATITVNDHGEHHRLSGRAVRDQLARLYYKRNGRTPSSQAITDALATLGGIARYEGPEHAVHVRIAAHSNAVYLDLGDPAWRAVEITEGGWQVIAAPRVRFRRSRSLLALPEPTAGGSVDQLRDVISVRDDDDWHLVGGFLVGALRPTGPYPVLALDGEQGSGKSMTARMLRRSIDPSTAELRAEPREIRDLMIAAAGGRVIALDNVSHLQPWLSDALCRISTGGALSTRQLYTDGDEYVVEAVRPCMLTGITSVITRGDLLDRAIPITLPAISESKRRTESELWSSYNRAWPSVLGALLDAVSTALAREADIQLASLPRMADWAVWVTAAAPALGWEDETIVTAYRTRAQSTVEASLDGDHVASAIRRLSLPWSGYSAELLKAITPAEPPSGWPPKGWPESPRGLSGALRRLAPLLRRVNIDVRLPDGAQNARERVIHIETIGGQQD